MPVLISEYRKLDEAGRVAAQERAKELAEWGQFGIAKLLLTEAAEQIRRDWPAAVAVVVEVDPDESYTNHLLTVQGRNETLLWTLAEGTLVEGSFAADPEEVGEASHAAAQLITEALGWKDDILDEIDTWRYAMWLVDWLEPEVDDPDEVPPGAATTAGPASISLDRLAEILTCEASAIDRHDVQKLMRVIREGAAALDAAPGDEPQLPSSAVMTSTTVDQEVSPSNACPKATNG